MQLKDLIALTGIPVAIVCGTMVLCLLPQLRNWAFLLAVAGAVVGDRLDVNLMSQHWYRGTTRGFEFSFVDILAWALVLSTILTPQRHQKRFYLPASFLFMLVYLGVAIFSVSTSQPKLFGMFEVSKILRAIVCFWAAALHVQSERELKFLVLGIATAVWLQGLLAMKHRVFLHLDRATGSLDHANSLSMYLCLTGPFLVAAATSAWDNKWIRRYCQGAIALACVAILLTVSRAGIPTFAFVMLGATVFCVSLKITFKKVAVAGLLMCGLIAAVAVNWNLLKERFLDATWEEETNTEGFENRGQYFGLAKHILRERSQGVGLNNWSYWVSKRYGQFTGTIYEDYDDIPKSMLDSPVVYDWGPKFAPPAHNLGVITVGEMGWIGLAAFAVLWLRWFWLAGSFLSRKWDEPLLRMGVGIFFGMLGVFLQSVTEWVFRQTTIILTFHFLIGTVAALYYLRHRKWAYMEALEEADPPPIELPTPRRKSLVNR
jgi:O-antigen ligase